MEGVFSCSNQVSIICVCVCVPGFFGVEGPHFITLKQITIQEALGVIVFLALWLLLSEKINFFFG